MAKAAVTRSIRDDHQKNFLKIFNGLTGKHSRWEIWEDFFTLTAIEISNSTDKVNATERTKMYQTIISKYSAKERDGMAEMLAEVVMGMEQNPDQDFLGSLYMMCELGNDHAGQFFTPYDVCRCMAEITFDPKLHPDMEGFISVSDPACGAGATLLAFLNVCKRRNICYHNKVLVIAQDIDFIVGLMCYIQCSFMGCAGYVVIGDTLVNPATAYDSRGLLPAGPQNRIWYINFGYRGSVIPLRVFDTKVDRSGRVVTRVKKSGARQALDHAFEAKMGSHYGIYERQGEKRFPVKELFGPATPQMMYSNENVMDSIEAKMASTYEERIEHEITRVLNGWGV